MRLNRDTIVAIALLVICGVFWQQSFEIRDPGYPGQLSPAAWPRAVLGALSFLCLIYLVQSLRQGPDAPADDAPSGSGGAVIGFVSHWRNVLWCFVLFLAYLLVMPWLGMLIAGTLFVFLLLCALGGWSARLLALHAAIALCTMGGMWMLFTYGLNVFLPAGSLIGRY
jgi:hypothetical protein